MTDTKKVRFANDHVESGEKFKQGEVYEVPVADARHYLRVGKVTEVGANAKTLADRESESRGKSAADTKDGGKTADEK